MKWLLYVIMFVGIFHRKVYADRTEEASEIEINVNHYGKFLTAGARKGISCKGSTKTERVEWYEPSGRRVKPDPKNRVFVKENFPKAPQSAIREIMLLFTEISVQDSGIWQCRSGNLEKNVSVCVLDPVKLVGNAEGFTVDKGRSVQLTCQARGSPEPNIMWYRNGEVIADDNSNKYKVMMKYSTEELKAFLTIVSLEPVDSGVYTCIALQENHLLDDCFHTESFNITVNVNYGPIFENENNTSKFVYARRNERVELKCDAKGYPTLTYRWFREYGDILTEIIENLENGSQSSFFLKADNETIGKKFSCQAANVYGISYKNFTVLLLEKPKQPTEISVLNSTVDKLDLKIAWLENKVLFPIESFEFQFNEIIPGRKYQRYEPYGTIVRITDFEINFNSEEFYVTLPNLEADTEYWIWLRAINDAGKSAWSEPFLANTAASLTNNSIATDIADDDDFTCYGLIFGGAILVIAIIWICVAKLL